MQEESVLKNFCKGKNIFIVYLNKEDHHRLFSYISEIFNSKKLETSNTSEKLNFA